MRNAVVDLTTAIRRHFPARPIQIIEEHYPVPLPRAVAGQLCQILFFVGLGAVFMFRNALPAPIAAVVAENQSAVVIGLFLLNLIGGSLLQSGAFEVTLDGTLLHSKLQTGTLPELNSLFAAIQKRL